ncbi:MAG: enoyl-CoA hydratase [Dehalococcoidia bacterium]
MTDDHTVFVDINEQRHRARVATITFGAKRVNVFDSVTIEQVTVAFEKLATDDELRAVVLTGGTDRSFSMGADVKEMAALDVDGASAFITRLHRLCDAVRATPVPVIARIQGHCLGAGLEVAASCDLRIASDDSSFGMPEILLGVPSVIEAALLPALIGWGKTRELVYTGATIDAHEAARIGLVERVVPVDELDAALEQWVGTIASVASPSAVRLQKQLIRRWETLPLNDAIEAGIASFRAAYETGDPQRLMREWIDGRRRE